MAYYANEYLLLEDFSYVLLENDERILIGVELVMNRTEVVLVRRGETVRRQALNSPLKQGVEETVGYLVDFTPWGASSSYPVSSPILKVLDQDGNDVTFGNHVSGVSVNTAGSGYSADDVLTITEANSSGDATVTVLTVGGSGEVLTIELTDVGYNYTAGSGRETTGGGGSGFKTNISVTDAELVVKGSVSASSDVQVRWNMANFINDSRYSVFIKGTINSLVGECWTFIDGEL